MNKFNTVSVFLGANFGDNPAYLQKTKQLAMEIAKRQLTLVYGGGRLGLMGVLADAVLEQGGKVIGVMAAPLYEKEAHLGLPVLHVANSMQERKAMMAELSDGCIALPGGIGTFEEVFEYWSAIKIGIYNKTCGLFNINHYYDKMIDFLRHVVDEGFLSEEHLELIKVSDNPSDLLDLMLPMENLIKTGS